MSPRKTRNCKAHLERAKSLFGKGRYRDASVILESSIPEKRNAKERHALLADCYRNLGKFHQAIPLYNKLLNVDPTNQQAISNLFV